MQILEPNGNTNENCVEFRLEGQWNDYQCSGELPFVCEKKGYNYIEPKPPQPPQPQCPQGWRLVRDRCLYLSYENSRMANNWTEARQLCEGQGASMMSIRDQADLDSIKGT